MRVIARFLTISALWVMLASVNYALAAVNIDDGRKTHHFAQTPQRVVVLDWDLLEQLITLNIIPVGATELASYNQWVVYPAAANTIEEVGTRAEPNLEKIASLKPDIILATASQQDLLSVLEKIAPVIYLPNFAKQNDAAHVAISHFKILAQLFNKSELADQKLAELDASFAKLKLRLQQRFPMLPEVAVLRFSNMTTVFLYTENSTTNYVLMRLGLKAAIPLPAESWGIEQRRINALQHISTGYVLYILPFLDEKKLQSSVLWQAMPFVRNGHINSIPPVWNYGGITSLQLMAEAITKSLLEVSTNS